MPAVSLHGVTVAWSSEALAIDPLAELLSMVAPGAPGDREIRFVLRPAGAATAEGPEAEGWAPSFFHGIVQAYRRGDDFLLFDRASRVLLRPGGAPVEAEIAPPDREIEPGSAGAMLQIALALALRPARLFHLHAAALAPPAGGSVLVVGGSGAGKTTTTLALIEAGARYLGDDALFLAEAEGGVRVAAFPRAFHLAPATLAAFPRLAPLAGPPGGRRDKRPLDPRRAFPDHTMPALSLQPGRALALFPNIAGGPVTEIAPLARADAFGLLLASSAAVVIDGLPGRDENLRLLQAVLAASRCYELRLGADALADPRGAVAARVEALLG